MNEIPKCFYFTEIQSKVKYDSIPTGALNIDRLLAGLPPFPMPTPAREEKKKKLVLADWTISAWNEEKIDSCCKVLTLLMKQGFSIYRWKDGNVIPLQKLDLEKKLAVECADPDEKKTVLKPENITPIEEVRLAASTQQKISQDQIQILDDYWMNYLISSKTLEPRVIRVSEIPELTHDNIDIVVKLMRSATPKLEKIILDKFSLWPNITTQLLVNAFAAEDTIVIEVPKEIVELNLKNTQFSSQNLLRILQSATQAETINLDYYWYGG